MNAVATPAAAAIRRERRITVVPDIPANAGGVVVSSFDWVQDLHFQFWKEAEVNHRLRDVLVGAHARVAALLKKEGVDLRSGALMVGVSRLARAMAPRGLYPEPLPPRAATARPEACAVHRLAVAPGSRVCVAKDRRSS